MSWVLTYRLKVGYYCGQVSVY